MLIVASNRSPRSPRAGIPDRRRFEHGNHPFSLVRKPSLESGRQAITVKLTADGLGLTTFTPSAPVYPACEIFFLFLNNSALTWSKLLKPGKDIS